MIDKQPQYYAYKSYVREMESYSLLPLTENTPYIDGMFYPDQCILLLLTKSTRETFQMVPKLDQFGNPEFVKVATAGNKHPEIKDRMERTRLEIPHQHMMSDMRDIIWFAAEYVANADDFSAFVNESFDKKLQAKKEEPQKEVQHDKVSETENV